MVAGTSGKLQRQLAEIEQLDASAVRREWRHLLRSDPPQLSRDLIVRALAYRLQEQEHGGLSKMTLRLLTGQIRELDAAGSERAGGSVRIRPGSRLVREWRGRTHTVTVTDQGFEYDGKSYGSLTPIAKMITGAHWSGPRFFGLNKRQSAATSTSRASESTRLAFGDAHRG